MKPKLTDGHAYKTPLDSIKVKFATEVFRPTASMALSVTIAVGALDGAAEPTVKFIERMNSAFHCFNTKHPEMSHPRKHNSVTLCEAEARQERTPNVLLQFAEDALKRISVGRLLI